MNQPIEYTQVLVSYSTVTGEQIELTRFDGTIESYDGMSTVYIVFCYKCRTKTEVEVMKAGVIKLMEYKYNGDVYHIIIATSGDSREKILKISEKYRNVCRRCRG